MRNYILMAGMVMLTACGGAPGSEKWCEKMQEQPKSQWTAEDAKTFTTHCILDSTTIGSKAWCEKLGEKDKGDWTASEAADYARHCVI